MTIEVLVKLAARDPWSFTVQDALARKLGIEALVGVERLKSWRLDFGAASEEDALGLTMKILDETALLANPNRDVRTVRSRSHPEIPDTFLGGPPGDGRLFAVRVADREDLVGRSVRSILVRRLGISRVDSVRYSLVWVLRFEAAGRDLSELAEEIAVARSWRKGLLANPHCQEALVRPVEEFVEEGAGLV
jgi:phosphoribosylformylglycinamidine (FGAM) synthase PurS component